MDWTSQKVFENVVINPEYKNKKVTKLSLVVKKWIYTFSYLF
jgi:hypothetical protein